MLRITHSKNAAGASKYFDDGLVKSDYYSTGQASIGRWGGKAAVRLGLSGDVDKADFVALCNNQKPDGSKLNPRHSSTRKVGYDFTFSAPKSVSIAYAIGDDTRIRDVFEQAVEDTMAELETDMRTQEGQGKAKQYKPTGEMIWASFTHHTSRPVDGVPDPHLHRHAYAFNTTWNADKRRFQAGEFSSIKRDAPYYEAAFDARLAAGMKQLGYTVERRGHSWEIRGLEESTLTKFSRRTAEIESRAADDEQRDGPLSAKQKEQLGALTRAKKLIGRSWQQLQSIWRSWLSDSENQQLQQAKQSVAGEKKKEMTAAKAVGRAEEHLFERKSVVGETQLKAEALKRGYGDILPEDVHHVLKQSNHYYRREHYGKPYITTQSALELEHRMISHVRDGRGSQAPLNPWYQPKATYLNNEQKAAIRHALTDTNNVTIIAGGAGTGKTTLMKEVRDGIQERGHKLMSFAPSAAASRGVLRSEGFDQADTVAALLHNSKLQEQCKGGVIWIDEAGLVGNKDMNRLFEIAKQQEARLLLTGDTRQHKSVTAGDALRILEQEAGIKVARVSAIQRQRANGQYKAAVAIAARGNGDAALLKLDRMGYVHELTDRRERQLQLVDDVSRAETAGQTTLVISPTHAEGKAVTYALRERFKQDGKLAQQERLFTQLRSTQLTEEQKKDPHSYRSHELALEFHQNAEGYIKGERWQVDPHAQNQLHGLTALRNGNTGHIDLKQADRFTVYRQEQVPIAKGERIRITKGGKTREGTRINNGDFFTVTGFTKNGHMKLHTGKTLDKEFGHITHGYVTTSHAAQGKTVDHVFIAQSSTSTPAASREQFYVSISRGRKQCSVYTDDKRELEQAIRQDNSRMSARELASIDRRRSRRRIQEKEKTHSTVRTRTYGRDHAL